MIYNNNDDNNTNNNKWFPFFIFLQSRYFDYENDYDDDECSGYSDDDDDVDDDFITVFWVRQTVFSVSIFRQYHANNEHVLNKIMIINTAKPQSFVVAFPFSSINSSYIFELAIFHLRFVPFIHLWVYE